MTVAWMFYALGVGALIAVAAVTAEWALKSAGRSVRFVWVGSIALTLLLTLLAPLRAPKPAAQVILPVITVVSAPLVEAPQLTLVERARQAGRLALGVLVMPVRKSMEFAKAAPRIANVSASLFWCFSAAISFLIGVVVYTRSMRASVRWPRMFLLGRSVRVAPDVGPAVMGMAPPEIVIPQWVLKRTTEEQLLVLEHESEHVRARDPLLLVFGCAGVAVMPWNPAVWFLWSRLRLAVELDCDQRVLRRGVQKPAYGELLVELSSRRPWDSLAMPAFSWGTSHLEKRLVAMTARRSRFSSVRLAAGAGVVAVALLAACNSEMPTAAQVQAMDVSTLAARVPLADSTLYFVDERVVSAAEAKEIVPDEIASVEVRRANAKNRVSEVHVTLVSDSLRELRIASRSGTTHKGDLRDVVVEDAQVKPALRVQGDSITLLARPFREVSDVSVDKAAPVEEASRLLKVDGQMRIVSDSVVATVSGAKVNLRARQPICLPDGSMQIKATVGVDGQFRGTGTMSQSAPPVAKPCAGSPLFIVDGVIMNNQFEISQLKTEDIESIEVIKGQSASNLYGAKAANGVISVKTKK